MLLGAVSVKAQITRWRHNLMLPDLLTNVEIQKYYQNEPKLNVGYARNNLTKMMDGTYITTGIHRIAWYVNANNITYFDCSRVENIPKEIKKFIGNKNIIASISRIPTYDTSILLYWIYSFYAKG